MNKKHGSQHIENKKIIDFDEFRIKRKRDYMSQKKHPGTEPTSDISLYEMLFDPENRQAIFDYYDEKYEETAEENEIYKAMRNKPYQPK